MFLLTTMSLFFHAVILGFPLQDTLETNALIVLKRITEISVEEAGSGWGQDSHVTADAGTNVRSKKLVFL